MDFLSLFYLFVLVACGWIWMKSIRMIELARMAAREACIKAEVQFLDDSVASTGIKLRRNRYGSRVLRRTYRFEFTETGNSRHEGQVNLLGDSIESVTMDPYQILS
jgi:hypothetical protein